MAFPDVSTLLDDFNRSDRTLNGDGIWASTQPMSANNWVIAINSAGGADVDNWNAVRTTASYDRSVGKVEVYWDHVGATSDNGKGFGACMSDDGDGYILTVFGEAVQLYTLWRFDNDTPTALISNVAMPFTPAAGDRFGLELYASGVINVWMKDGAGAWTKVNSTTDSTYMSGGIGGAAFGFNHSLDGFDNVWGGEFETSAAVTGTVVTGGVLESEIVAGGETVIVTLTGDTWVPATETPAFSTGTAKSTTTAPGRTGDGDLTCSWPPSYTPTAGHFALIILYNDDGDGSTPTDWTEVTGSPWGSATPKLQAFYKVLVGSDTEPVTTISGSGTNISHCANMAIYPLVKGIGAIGTASAGTGSPMTAGGITTTAANSIVIGICGRGDNESASNQTFGASSTGVTEQLDGGTSAGNDSQVSMYDKFFASSSSSSGDGSADTSATDPWVSVLIELLAKTPFADARQDIIDGMDSAQSEGTGWDAVVKAGASVSEIVRTSDTVMTRTLAAYGSYAITADETITVTVPASAVNGGEIVASPTFVITNGGGGPATAVKDIIQSGYIAFAR